MVRHRRTRKIVRREQKPWQSWLNGPVLVQLIEFADLKDLICFVQVCRLFLQTSKLVPNVFVQHFAWRYKWLRRGVVMHLSGNDLLRYVEAVAYDPSSSDRNPRLNYKMELWTSATPLYNMLHLHRMPDSIQTGLAEVMRVLGTPAGECRGAITMVRDRDTAHLVNVNLFGEGILSVVPRDDGFLYATTWDAINQFDDVLRDILKLKQGKKYACGNNPDVGIAFDNALRQCTLQPGCAHAETTAEIEWTLPNGSLFSAHPVYQNHQQIISYLYSKIRIEEHCWEGLELVRTIIFGKSDFLVLAFEPPLRMEDYVGKFSHTQRAKQR